jgi:hypothetical protein
MIFWYYFCIIQLYLLNVTCIVLYIFGPVATHGHAPSTLKVMEGVVSLFVCRVCLDQGFFTHQYIYTVAER